MTSHRAYAIDPGAPLPGLTGLPGGAEAGEPRSYAPAGFDTEDLTLAAHGIRLNHRDGHWRLTLLSGAEERLPGPARTVPARFVAAHARGRPLVPVTTRRTVIPLLGPDGETLGEITDDAVRASGVWREITVVSGSPELLEAVAERLLAAGARPAPQTPEYRTTGDVVTSYVAEQRAIILAYDPKVRLAVHDSVHKMRVAVRRTRSILRTAARLLEPEPAGRLEAELKWLAGELGEVRDLEVLRERFAGRLAELGEPAPSWLAGLGEKERLAYVRLNHTLLGERYFALLDALDAFVADPPFTGRASRRARKVNALVAGAWRRVARRHAELEHAEDPDEARHRTRKAAKRARYTAEAARPVLGEPARRLAAQASRVQETLGAYQDSVIARERLAELDTGGEDARTIDALIGVERGAAAQALADARDVWAEAEDIAALEMVALGRDE
ncbi:CHAD domain-containing protein [Actinomadura sp. DC4]|uniref:CYTH and CHAD domain-containing protein n=1 Tax=Actinomadura sp. DC4 TaxID=3055069 RepID=UPI0025B273E8|nr:CHAD domain-containing protein [Actinomadura sp. DC4]MDN3357047.1 CHAD domain-containing protein [Actinomadura sp. DC4]